MKSVANGSYFFADYDNYLNIELHCIGAMGEGMWINPNGSLLMTSDIVASASASASGQETSEILAIASGQGLGTSVLAHMPVLDSDLFGSITTTNPFTNPADEGYYTCIAADEYGNKHNISVGLFLQGRGKPGLEQSMTDTHHS